MREGAGSRQVRRRFEPGLCGPRLRERGDQPVRASDGLGVRRDRAHRVGLPAVGGFPAGAGGWPMREARRGGPGGASRA
ncbi:hypothetical protein PSMK_05560 [Phycisphaera mikurensis NBRC 102666]|uniref:Uncharacterized protein n=1 Tax=Phycisphaera mikurensis (strain NBRC 102666 / KCTC 22515 / FYK2301M01) TaxID=1142394 RepID=I0IBS7_PHYMF|nr:hypothetical protein PSMK_05560 [Phycisphaera mikurensis NBRC 102666]